MKLFVVLLIILISFISLTPSISSKENTLMDWGVPLQPWNRVTVSSPFGRRFGDNYEGVHRGIDLSFDRDYRLSTLRKNIYSIADGVIQYIFYQKDGAGWGIIIDHENGFDSRYYHLGQSPRDSHNLNVGDRILKGDIIGFTGNTGNSTSVLGHLHFEIWDNRNDSFAINPVLILPTILNTQIRTKAVTTVDNKRLQFDGLKYSVWHEYFPYENVSSNREIKLIWGDTYD